MKTFVDSERVQGGRPLPALRGANIAALTCLLLSAASCDSPGAEQPVLDEPATVIRWSSGAPLPIAKGGHTSGVVGSQLVITGGTHWQQDRKIYADSVEAYDPASDRWTHWSSLPHPLAYAAGASFENDLYIGGGTDGTSDRTNVYTLRQGPGDLPGEWVELEPLPQPRVFAAGVVTAGRFLIIGGANRSDDLSSVSNDLLSLPLSGSSGWENGNPLPGVGRALHAASSCAGAVYVFGGYFSDSDGTRHNLSDAYVYRPEQDQWEPIRPLPWPVRGQSAACYQDRFVLLAGGYRGSKSPEEGGFRREVIAYDTASNAYFALSPMPQGVMDSEAQIYRDMLLVAGGESRARGRSNLLAIGKLPDGVGWLGIQH